MSAEQLHVLALAALLPADQIALPWLRAVGSEEFSALKADIEPAANATWQQCADSLLSLRLFQPGGDARVARMHRLVQELMRKDAADAVAISATALLAHIKSRAEFLWEGWVHHEHRWELGPLVACAWQWMEQGRQDGTYLATRAFGPLHDLGNFAESEALMRRALAIDEQRFGSNLPTSPAPSTIWLRRSRTRTGLRRRSR